MYFLYKKLEPKFYAPILPPSINLIAPSNTLFASVAILNPGELSG
jgi:hypothetical protein